MILSPSWLRLVVEAPRGVGLQGVEHVLQGPLVQPAVLVPVLPVQAVEHQFPVLRHLVELDRAG